MAGWLILLLRFAVAAFKGRRNLLLENLALRHQLLVLNRTAKRPRLSSPDRALWAWLSQSWRAWKRHLRIVQLDAVVRWHRAVYHRARTHLGLDKDAPEPPPVQPPTRARSWHLPK